jgi:hypothetical protein
MVEIESFGPPFSISGKKKFMPSIIEKKEIAAIVLKCFWSICPSASPDIVKVTMPARRSQKPIFSEKLSSIKVFFVTAIISI